MAYFAIWFLFNVLLLFAPFYANCRIIDFIFKYKKRQTVKCSHLIIIYPFKINYSKNMNENFYKGKKSNCRYASIHSLLFQIINYIYLFFTFIIMILKIIFDNNKTLYCIFYEIIKFDILYFVILLIIHMFSLIIIKKLK